MGGRAQELSLRPLVLPLPPPLSSLSLEYTLKSFQMEFFGEMGFLEWQVIVDVDCF